MAGFIGNVPATNYESSLTQTFSTPTGTSHTLTYSVANSADILVVINNVIQEPDVGYAVSGTTLTTDTLASGDTMYVYYLALARNTTTPPALSIDNSMVAAGAAIDQSKLAAISGSDLPAGTIIQMKADYQAGGLSTSSATFADTGLSIDITPTSTSNDIIIFASLECSKNGAFALAAGIRLLRDATQVYNVDWDIYDQDAPNVFLAMNKSIFIEDSPASVSSLTYKIQMNASAGTNTMALAATSSMFVMEVAR